jgi:putative salt-induced outer membrane protein YdiY
VHDHRYSFAAGINRATDREVTTAQNWTASARYDRFLTDRLFVNGSAIFTNDRFRDLRLRGAYGVGLGHQVIDRPLVKFSVDAGVGYVNEDFDVAADDSYGAVRESGKLDLVAVPDRVVFFHQHDGYFGVTGDDNLFVQTQNGVRLTLVAGWITTVRLDLDYDRSPAPGRTHVDRTAALTLGYRF